MIEPLYGAFGALLEAREKRGTLDLEVPEVQIRLDGSGRPIGARGRARLDSHRLIEEMMIAANVAAAETLEQASAPCMYRVHDRPDPVKIEALVQLLDSLGLARGRGALAKPKDLTRLIRRLETPELTQLVSTHGAAGAEPGGLQPAQSRPFRPQSRPLCAFHLADPALCRPAGAPRPDPRR